MLAQLIAEEGRPDAAGMAGQQRMADHRFEFGDPAAQGGGRDLPALGRPRDAAGLADQHEQLQRPEIELAKEVARRRHEGAFRLDEVRRVGRQNRRHRGPTVGRAVAECDASTSEIELLGPRAPA